MQFLLSSLFSYLGNQVFEYLHPLYFFFPWYQELSLCKITMFGSCMNRALLDRE